MDHCMTVEAVTLNFVRVYDIYSLYNSTDISAKMQIAALIRSPEPVIELDVRCKANTCNFKWIPQIVVYFL